MADSKISALSAATSLDSADELVVNDSGTTKKITVDNFSLAAISQNHAGEYSGGGGDISVADTNYVTVGSQSFSITAGDIIICEAHILLLNNSGGTKTYTMGLYVDTFGVDFADGATIAANASNRAYCRLTGCIEVRSSSVAKIGAVLERWGPAASNTVSSLALADSRGGWAESTSDFTGTKNVKFAIKSSANNATQTMTILGWRFRKST